MNALIGQLDQSVLLCEQDARIHSELKKNAELQHEIEKRDTLIIELNLQIINKASHLEQQAQHVSELNSQLEQQAQHVSKLERVLNIIYNSASWKLMGPIRRAGRILGADKNSDSDVSDSDK